MDTAIEYFFGTGDGTLSHWTSTADTDMDGDGVLDAIALDFDGDGRIDDVMWDVDGDGMVDTVGLDLDDDGVPDSFYTDDGTGVWAIAAPPPHADVLDTDGDGVPDLVLLDTDGDGYADAYRPVDADRPAGAVDHGGTDSAEGTGTPSAR